MAKNDINEKYIKCYRWFWTVLRFFSFANNNVLKEMHNRLEQESNWNRRGQEAIFLGTVIMKGLRAEGICAI